MNIDENNIRLINVIITKLAALKEGKTLQKFGHDGKPMDLGICSLGALTLCDLSKEGTVWVKPERVLTKKPLPRSYFEPGTKITFQFDQEPGHRIHYAIESSDMSGFTVAKSRYGYHNMISPSFEHTRIWDNSTEQWIKPYTEVWETPATT